MKTKEELLDDIERAKGNLAEVEAIFLLAEAAVAEAELAMENRLVSESYQHDAQVDHPGMQD